MGNLYGNDINGVPRSVKVDDEGRLIATSEIGAPVMVESPAAKPLVVSATVDQSTFPTAKVDDDDVANNIDIGAASAQYTLPGQPGDYYTIIAIGGTAYMEAGANPTVTTAQGGYSLICPEGQILGPIRLTGPKVAVIGTAAAGVVTFLHHNPLL